LLQYLVTHANHALTLTELLIQVWKDHSDIQPHTVAVHMHRFRSRLGIAGQQIQTIPSVGYRFNEE
jgi:two-component system, OmpR family, alkaline phosphatase synthesis response regulator PhoP